MKIEIFTLIAIIGLVPVVFGAQGMSYYSCDSPLNQYKCYNTQETPVCPETGLNYVRGWCPGNYAIRCCAPLGTPEGVRTNGPGITHTPPANIKTQDFKLFLEGTLLCDYQIKSNGVITKHSKYSCDSYITITVGPNGDCRNEGTDTCVVTNDGGYMGTSKEYIFSIKFQKPVSSYGSCKKYTSFNCLEENDCRETGGTPLRGFCPGTPANIKCCLYQSPESKPQTDKLFFDKTKNSIIANPEELNNKLNIIKENNNARIIIVVMDDMPTDSEKKLRDDFYLRYDMGKYSSVGMEMVLIYSKNKNSWRGIGLKDCKLNAATIKSILPNDFLYSDSKINYDTAFMNFIDILKQEIEKRVSVNSLCKTPGETIKDRLEAVKNGYKGFILNDPVCEGVNCAKYVTRAHEYIFGIGKHFITGVGGNAWNIPGYVKTHGGSVDWFDWKNGKTFTNYDSLIPGDLIGFHYTKSDFRPDVKYQAEGEDREIYGWERGNTKDIDFTHVALYLGKIGNEHIITHLYHQSDCPSCEPVKTESIESLMRNFPGLFHIRAVIRPDQERLYRTISDTYNPEYETKKIQDGTALTYIVPGTTDNEKEQYAWITADKNHMVENVIMEKFVGLNIKIPKSLPEKYENGREDDVIGVLAKLIQKREDDGIVNLDNIPAREWARSIVTNSISKTNEEIAILAALTDTESKFLQDSQSERKILGVTIPEEPIRTIDIYTTNLRTYTVGPMNVQTCKAEGIALKTGRHSNSPLLAINVFNELKTADGGIFYGAQIIKEILNEFPPPYQIDDEKAMNAMIEHNNGIFYLRNKMLQIKINDIMKVDEKKYGYYKIVPDGDFLSYDNCEESMVVTNSETSVRKLMKNHNIEISESQIRNDLRLEKKKEFENTQTYKEIEKLWDDINLQLPRDVNLDKSKDTVVSNTIEIVQSTGIISISVSPSTIKPGNYVIIKSNAKTAISNIKYHTVTVKILNKNGLTVVEEKKTNCGENLFCSAYVTVPSNVDGGIIQYWSDIGLSNGETLREPVSGTLSQPINMYYNCNDEYSSFMCMNKNYDKCNGNFIPSFCKGPENIQCCVNAASVVNDGGNSVGILSVVDNDLKGVLLNQENLCNEVIMWELRDAEDNSIEETGTGNIFVVENPSPKKYYAVFYCSLVYTFDDIHPDFNQFGPLYYQEKMSVYSYYKNGLNKEQASV